MLSQQFFDRLISSHGLRFEALPTERRVSGSRVPHRRAVALITITGGILTDVLKGTVRDVSLSGVGVVVERDRRVSREWLVCFGAKLCTGPDSSVLLCRTTRTTPAGPATSIIGASFLSVLAPGQMIRPGLAMSSYVWLPVEGENAVDPDKEFGEGQG